ncbi:SpoIIE family protein phosphatase [Streptomyces sp. NPDC059152]|uniref:SpoIIE family protein phosphatase n=1 Tax=Streptomyces sp. NPDC059152 TaxID=3346742 RepID=UPI0036A8B1D3
MERAGGGRDRLGTGLRSAEPSEPALPLGLAELSTDQDRTDTVPFPSGATLLLYTDGLNEARNRAGDFYDPAAGLAGVEFAEPDALLETLLTKVNRHTAGRITDDLALLAVTRTPAAPRDGTHGLVPGER